MTYRILLLIASIGLLLVAACDKKDASLDETLSKAKEAVTQASDAADGVKSAVANLSQDKIEDLAKIAAKLETAPAEAKKMLEEHDWSMDEFEKMVEQVKANEATKKIFDAAKKLASEH